MIFSKDTIYDGKRLADATEMELKRFYSYWAGRGEESVVLYDPLKVRYINETKSSQSE